MFKILNNDRKNNEPSVSMHPGELRIERDEIYNQILKNFEVNHGKLNTQRRRQKCIFFWMVCCSFIGILLLSGYLLLKFAWSDDFSYKNLVAIFGSFATIISSIIILPNVIAKHLFPKSGEDIGLDIIKTIQNIDTSPEHSPKITIDDDKDNGSSYEDIVM